MTVDERVMRKAMVSGQGKSTGELWKQLFVRLEVRVGQTHFGNALAFL